MTNAEDFVSLHTTVQCFMQFHRLQHGRNRENTIVPVDIIGHVLTREKTYLKAVSTQDITLTLVSVDGGPIPLTGAFATTLDFVTQ